MGTVGTPQLVDTIDLLAGQRSHSGAVVPLDRCQVERWGLSIERATPEDPAHDGEVTWLMPELGLRLTRRRSRRRHSRREPSRLTVVRIERGARSWVTTDLLLGLQIPDQGAARIVQAEEFATAISAGMIRLSEADYALRTAHRTLEEITQHRDINQWLAYRGIFDLW
ncbi:hypothetical protein ACL03H_12765 [Saccharopolyspora sp. MS10]|uniref:hypothetical protein n=1 Tax=Saccharopolyspora sp. MS10 TaxID=3385973 RepID=UPI0039A1C96F